MQSFKCYHKEHILSLTRLRRFETKLGERVEVVSKLNEMHIANAGAKFVVFGIPEHIGVKANHGIGGADTVWPDFLQAFLNMQSNDFFNGSECLLLGHFDFSALEDLVEDNAYSATEKTDAFRHAVQRIDTEVEALVKMIVAAGKIPIAIGGGHNNAYPLIKGTAKGLHQLGRIPIPQINCINLDAHTDYRAMEGRHSGNAFRYAEEDGYLQKYFVLGVQENFIPQNVWIDIVNNPFIDLITFEDIFIHEKRNFVQAAAHAAEFTEDNYTGIELDLDAISNVLSSAMTPSGISSLHARQYVNMMAAYAKPAYFHICEGAAALSDGRTDAATGKLIALLACDFMKAMQANGKA
ncbi:MAG: arginase family protein [Chitinophagaceae bacterium]